MQRVALHGAMGPGRDIAQPSAVASLLLLLLFDVVNDLWLLWTHPEKSISKKSNASVP
jgi:hypothetical protein